MTETTFIYALCEPDTDSVRYIGKADNPEKRFLRHMSGIEPKPTHKSNWISSLKNKNQKPTLLILEEINRSNWQECERKWIKYYKNNGAKLTNIAEGGIGGRTLTAESLSSGERKRRSDTARARMNAMWDEIRKEKEVSRKHISDYLEKENLKRIEETNRE